jgi:hypothetical protein
MIRNVALQLALLVGLAGSTFAQRGPWVVGEPLPSLRLPTIDGTDTVDLASLRGTRLLLIEFASW